MSFLFFSLPALEELLDNPLQVDGAADVFSHHLIDSLSSSPFSAVSHSSDALLSEEELSDGDWVIPQVDGGDGDWVIPQVDGGGNDGIKSRHHQPRAQSKSFSNLNVFSGPSHHLPPPPGSNNSLLQCHGFNKSRDRKEKKHKKSGKSSSSYNLIPVTDAATIEHVPGIGEARVVPALLSNKPISLASAGPLYDTSLEGDLLMRAMSDSNLFGEDYFNAAPPVAAVEEICSTQETSSSSLQIQGQRDFLAGSTSAPLFMQDAIAASVDVIASNSAVEPAASYLPPPPPPPSSKNSTSTKKSSSKTKQLPEGLISSTPKAK